MKERIFKFNQVGTAGNVEISEKGGLTIAFPTEDETLYVWEETDTAGDVELPILITYLDENGIEHTATIFLDDTDTTTAVETEIEDFYRLVSAEIEQASVKYIAFGNSDKSAIWGVIEEGKYQSLHSRYTAPSEYQSWLGEVEVNSNVAAGEINLTFTQKNKIEDTLSLKFGVGTTNHQILVELEPLSDVVFELKGNTADTLITIKILELI
jgi:hypothetical protein